MTDYRSSSVLYTNYSVLCHYFLISAAIYIKIETGCEPFHAQKSTGTWYIFPYQSDENVYLKQNHKDIRDLWSLLSSEEKR